MLAAYIYAQPGISERLAQGQHASAEEHKVELGKEMEAAEKKLDGAGGQT